MGGDRAMVFLPRILTEELVAYTMKASKVERGEGMSDRDDQSLVDRVAGECLAARVRILNRAITGVYDEAMRPLGAKVSQMNILVATARLGVARPGRLCEILHMDTSTLSRNAERMVANGWLEVVPDADARAQPLRVTNAGMDLLRRALPAWEQAQARAREILGQAGASMLIEAVRNLPVDGPSR
jgi:DNA-binding MarR family transcriptional regulator